MRGHALTPEAVLRTEDDEEELPHGSIFYDSIKFIRMVKAGCPFE